MTTEKIRNQVRQIAADITAQPSGQDGSWDSLQLLNMVLQLEQNFDVHFSPEEINEMQNFDGITRLVEQKLTH